jgi:hypothetical protein
MKELNYQKIGELYKYRHLATIPGYKFYPYATTICAMRNLKIRHREIADFLCDELGMSGNERVSNHQLANYLWKWKRKGLLDGLNVKQEEEKIKLAMRGNQTAIMQKSVGDKQWDNL